MTKNSATFVYQDGLRCALEISHRGFFHRNLWNVFKVLKIEEPKELQASELWWKFLFQSYAGWGVNQLSTMPLFCSIQAIYWSYTGYKCKHPISLQIQKINSEAKGEGVWSIVMSNLGARVSWCPYGIWMLSNYTALCIYKLLTWNQINNNNTSTTPWVGNFETCDGTKTKHHGQQNTNNLLCSKAPVEVGCEDPTAFDGSTPTFGWERSPRLRGTTSHKSYHQEICSSAP